MRQTTFLILISALTLAVLSVPLILTFLPIGVACCLASVLLAVLAIPGLSEQSSPAAGPGAS